MGLFHKTLKDVEKLFEKDRNKALGIVLEHRKEAEIFLSQLRKNSLTLYAQDYWEALADLEDSLKKNDMQNAKAWIKYLEKELRDIKKRLKNLNEIVSRHLT
jgi:hypothetical protein